MKQFAFTLARVQEIRRAQANQERAELDRLLHAKQRLLSARKALEQSAEAQARALASPGAHGPDELQGVDRFASFVREDGLRTAREAAALDQQIQDQQWRVQQADQRCRLLEKLRDRQHEQWVYLAGKELEDLAAEVFLAQRHRLEEAAGRLRRSKSL